MFLQYWPVMQVSYTTWFKVKSIHILAFKIELGWVAIIVTRLGDLLDFGQLFKAFGNK